MVEKELSGGCSGEFFLKTGDTHEENFMEKKVNMITGIVGAVIGVLIGVAAWVGIYQLGYIAGIAGFIMMICSIKGFELLGGGLNVPAVILCIVIDIVAVYFAHRLAIAVSVMQELKYSFSQSYSYIPYLLEYEEFATAYYKDLAMD